MRRREVFTGSRKLRTFSVYHVSPFSVASGTLLTVFNAVRYMHGKRQTEKGVEDFREQTKDICKQNPTNLLACERAREIALRDERLFGEEQFKVSVHGKGLVAGALLLASGTAIKGVDALQNRSVSRRGVIFGRRK